MDDRCFPPHPSPLPRGERGERGLSLPLRKQGVKVDTRGEGFKSMTR